MSTNDDYEIVVWVAGHTLGYRFPNKTKDLANEIINCVGNGKGFKLKGEDSTMSFGPGMASHIQVTNIREP